MQTSADHAIDMLKTAGGIAGGLGAPPKEEAGRPVDPTKSGMVMLRIWVAERMAEISRSDGDAQKAREHEREVRGLQRVAKMRET